MGFNRPLGFERNNVTILGNLGAKQTMMFIHGFGTDQTAWQDVSGEFGERYRIVLLDNVGSGKSNLARFEGDGFRYADLTGYVLDLIEIVDLLELENAVLVGHSVGAMIALLASIDRSKAFSKLVTIGASPRYIDADGYRGGFTEKAIGDVHLAMNTDYVSWTQSFAPLVMANHNRPKLAEYFSETLRSIPKQIAIKVLLAIFGSDHRQDLCKVSVPTLIIQAREDIAVPLEVAEYMNQNIRNSQLAVIDATGHLPHVSAPQEVVRAMRGFGL